MAAGNYGPDYLVLITLMGTFDPVVTRVLSMPVTTTFEDLHHCIAASFGWKVPGEFEKQTWTFYVINEEPVPTNFPTIGEPLLRIFEGAREEDNRPDIRSATGLDVHTIFNDARYLGKPVAYSTAGQRDFHLLKVIGRSSDPDSQQITCVGGQGRIPFLPWYTEILEDERRGGWNTWDPGFDRIKTRLEQFQRRWEMGFPLGERALGEL